jgi:redox-sensing transcriptional repressor
MELPTATRNRLLQVLRILEGAGEKPLTSAELEAYSGWPSHTIRKDISCLSGAEQDESLGSGSGYRPERLIPAIRKALGLDKHRSFCVVGLGRLGSAFLNLNWGETGGVFQLAAGFDSNVNRVEILKSPAPLYPAYKMAEVIRRLGIEIALLCVPAEEAQVCAEKLAAAGIGGIVNFAPVALVLPPEVAAQNVYVIDQLRALAVKMQKPAKAGEKSIDLCNRA